MNSMLIIIDYNERFAVNFGKISVEDGNKESLKGQVNQFHISTL